MVKKRAVQKAIKKLVNAIAIITIECVAVFVWLYYGLQVATTLRGKGEK